MFPLRQFPVLLFACALSFSLAGCFGSRDVGTVEETPQKTAQLNIRSAEITSLAELTAELDSNGGNMVPLFESVPALLAEHIGDDKAKLAILNEQLKKEHVKRSSFGTVKSKTTEQTVEEGGDENVKFTLGDLVPMADKDYPKLSKLLSENEWLPKPVINSMDLMRERQAKEAKEGKPTTIAEMQKLQNTSRANNLKIRSAIGLLAAVDGSDVEYDATWNRHTGADVKSTNPLMISSTAEFDVAGLMGFGLFGFDWTFSPHGSEDSLKSWETSKNGLYDKVVLRDDLVWSDGTPITAHDIEFSYKVIMTSKVPVPAVRSGTDQLLGVKAYDDHTLIFFHPDPLATNVWNIMFPVIPKHVYKDSVADDPTLQTSPYHVEKDENPVTGGAYVLTKRVRGQQIVLERRKSYHTVNGSQVRDVPHFKTIRFAIIEDPNTALLALKRGDLEEIQLTPEQWKEQTASDDFYKNNTKAYDIEWVYFYFGWNFRSPFFRDARVRQAMSLAFDHAEMMERHRRGMDEQSTGVFHRTSPWAPPQAPAAYQQDLDTAEELLAAAGWTDTDDDGVLDGYVFLDPEFDGQINEVKRVKFEFTIVTSNRPDRILLCELLRENLDQVGIVCNVRAAEFTVLQQMARDHKFHAQLGGWGTGTDPDTSDNLWATKAIDSGRNYVCYTNPKIDELFQKGKYELDLEKRKEIYRQIHRQLYDDQPYTWLYFRNAYFAFNNNLRGVNFSARGPYNYGPGEGSIFKSPTAQ